MFKKIVNFGLVGVFVTLLDIFLLYIFTKYLHISPLIATPVAFTLAFFVNFVFSMKFVFKAKPGMSRTNQLIIFAGTAAVGLLVTQLVMYLGIEVFHAKSVLFVKVISIVLVMSFNFIARYKLLDKE